MLELIVACLNLYFLLLVVSYILLSSPKIPEAYGLLLLGPGCLLTLAIPGYLLLAEAEEALNKALREPLVLALIFLLSFTLLYALLRNVLRGVFGDKRVDEVIAICVAAYGATSGVMFFLLLAGAGLALASLALHIFVAKALLNAARKSRSRYSI